MQVTKLSDQELRQRVRHLVARDRAIIVEIGEHLAEVERRELHLTWGFSSLWDYCHRELGLTESVAYLRISLARLISQRETVKELILSGELGLCVAAELASHVEDVEFDDLLAEARKCSKREFKELIATRMATPVPGRDVVRRMASRKVASVAKAAFNKQSLDVAPTLTGQSALQLDLGETSASEASKSEKTHRISLSASEETVELMERLKDLMGTSDLNDILKASFDSHLEKIDPERREKRRVKRAARAIKSAPPRPVKTQSRTRRPPQPIIDRVLISAGGRCEYVGPNGVRCSATRHLQVDHVRPFALGGSSTAPSNLRALCRAHNQQLARASFGLDFRRARPKTEGCLTRRKGKGEATARL